jgi:hypothetical protein
LGKTSKKLKLTAQALTRAWKHVLLEHQPRYRNTEFWELKYRPGLRSIESNESTA